MLDHILGRPSAGLKRAEVLLTLLGMIYYLKRSPAQPRLRIALFVNKLCEKLPAWKIVLGTLSGAYFINNLFLLLNLNAPDPLQRMYTRNFYRATWILTALDAGFLTAMSIKPAPLRHVLSIIFSVFYLIFADKADEKVRKYRAVATTEMMRVSWEKSNTPILRAISYFHRKHLRIRKNISIPRPEKATPTSFPNIKLGPIQARLYFDGTEESFQKSTKLIVQLPGGGFVTMNPECHDDYVSEWARLTHIPIVSLNYGKAPEHPYPWALEECFDAYKSIVQSNGAVLGMKCNDKLLKIVLIGDSAGGNLSAGVVMKCIESTSESVHLPAGLILIYPCLSFDLACWMPTNHMNLIRAESVKSLPNLLKRTSPIEKGSPLSLPEAPKKIDISSHISGDKKSCSFWSAKEAEIQIHLPSSLSMTSRMSYFADRLISPEQLRAMALLYLQNSPVSYNFDSEYYLSPVVAPDELLSRFPRTFLLTGERDPLVDDTVVFSARLRKAKEKANKEWKRKSKANPSLHYEKHIFSRDPRQMVQMKILEGMSHAFFNMMAFLPESHQAVSLVSDWILDLFEDVDTEEKCVGQQCFHDVIEIVDQDKHVQESGIYPIHGSIAHYHQESNSVNGHPSTKNHVSSVNGQAKKTTAEPQQRSRTSSTMNEVQEQKIMERRRNQLASTHLT